MPDTREKLIELLETVVSPNELLCDGEVIVSTSRVADHLIANDVVPVVRCKDCKHYYYSAYAMRCVCDFDNKEWGKDDFCSYGERREGD